MRLPVLSLLRLPLLALLLLLAAGGTVWAQGPPPPEAQVTVNAANVRTGPGTQHSIAARAVRGQVLTVLGWAPSQDPAHPQAWLALAWADGRILWLYAPLTDADIALLPPQAAPAAPLRPPPPAAAPAPARISNPDPATRDPNCRHVITDTHPVTARRGPGLEYPAVIDHPAASQLTATGVHVNAQGQRWVWLAAPAGPLYWPQDGRADFEQEWVAEDQVQAPCALPHVDVVHITAPLTFEFFDQSPRWDWQWQELIIWDALAPLFDRGGLPISHVRWTLADWPYGTALRTVWGDALTALWLEGIPYEAGAAFGPGHGPRWDQNPDLYLQEFESILQALVAGTGPPVPLPAYYVAEGSYCHLARGLPHVAECTIMPIYGQGPVDPLEAGLTTSALWNTWQLAYRARYLATAPSDYAGLTHDLQSELVTRRGPEDARGVAALLDSHVLTLTQTAPWPWEE